MNHAQISGRIVVGALTVLASVSHAEEFPKALPVEPRPSVVTLDTPYPPSFAVVHDFGFGSLIDSAFSLVDTDSGRFKGMLSAGNFATFNVSSRREELYVAETYYSRGTRGDRTDLVTIYGMGDLDRLAEVELPAKRAAIVVQKNGSAITESGRFLLVFNLTPATSVSVVDLDERAFAGEVQTPGCSLVYPTVDHDYFMLCSDGALLKVSLDDDGAVTSQSRSDPFIDIDSDPLSEKGSKIGSVWYFVSFKGDVQPISGAAEPGERWSLTTDAERADNWRPAGWHWTASHPDGLLWVGMTPNGYDGSHKDPAEEVWRFDVDTRDRQDRISLRTPALSIDVSLEEAPRLLVVNIEGALDVYDARTGEYQRTIFDLGASPYQVHRIP